MKACLVALPWCQTADPLPTGLLWASHLALILALCTLAFSDNCRKAGDNISGMLSHMRQDGSRVLNESHLERGYREQTGEYTRGQDQMEELSHCASSCPTTPERTCQSAGRRTCLLPASGTANKRVRKRLECYM